MSNKDELHRLIAGIISILLVLNGLYCCLRAMPKELDSVPCAYRTFQRDHQPDRACSIQRGFLKDG